MFNKARSKLTFFYSLIVAAILVTFSFGIYKGFTWEFDRIIAVQKFRMENPVEVSPGRFLIPRPIDLDLINESKQRILFVIILVDGLILSGSTLGGYFLAGKTLRPIEEMVNEQKQFVADASHELRTPIAALKSEIEVTLRDKKMKVNEAREILTSNLEEVNKIQRLTNYLLTLNKYQSNTSLVFTNVNLEEIVSEALKVTKPIATAKKIEIIKKLEKTTVSGNADSLTELAIILLDNAIKYSKEGGKIIVRTSKNSFSVEDFGVGIGKQDLLHIFDRFYRADMSRSKEKARDGYGLGLSIAKNIVELHKGSIKVDSQVNKGTTFSVTFNS